MTTPIQDITQKSKQLGAAKTTIVGYDRNGNPKALVLNSDGTMGGGGSTVIQGLVLPEGLANVTEQQAQSILLSNILAKLITAPATETGQNAGNIKLDNLLAALNTLIEVAQSEQSFEQNVFVDSTGTTYILRTIRNQDGSFSEYKLLADGLTNYNPVLPSTPVSSSVDYEYLHSFYVASTNGSGYSTNNRLRRSDLINTSTQAIAATTWFNQSTQSFIVAPNSLNIQPVADYATQITQVAILNALENALTVDVTNFPSTQTVNNTGVFAVQAAQSGIWNFGINGLLPAFAVTPTFNLGALNGAATAANQQVSNNALTAIADKDFLTNQDFNSKIGEVQSTPTANTLLDRLKQILGSDSKTLSDLYNALTANLTITGTVNTGLNPLTNVELRASPVETSGIKTEYNDASGVIISASVSQQILPINGDRIGVLVQNISDTDMYLNTTNAAGVNNGSFLLKAEVGSYETSATAKDTKSISIYCSVAGKAFTAKWW